MLQRKKLKNKSKEYQDMQLKAYALNQITDPILIFDSEDRLQVHNVAAGRMLNIPDNYTLDEYIRDNDLEYSHSLKGATEDRDGEFIRTKVLEFGSFLVHGKELWDEKHRYIGFVVNYTDITGQEKLKDEVTLYATRDQLTGLWNRDYFFEIAAKTIRENPEEEFVLLASDIYQFKLFNEILGTTTGDDLLLAFAQAYREHCKRMWVFSRIAADRFALLIPKSDYDEMKMLRIVEDVLERKNYSLRVHAYIGIYDIVDKGISVESMYDRAYMALESIKGDRTRNIAYYHEELLHKRIHETTTLDELDRALLNDEFEIYGQMQ